MDFANKLRNTQNNWLLYFGSISFTITFILLFIFESDEFVNSRITLFQNDSISIFIILAVLFAPIFEELSFRSFFTNKKWLIITGSIILPLVTYTETTNPLIWILLSIIYCFAFWNYKTPKKWKNITLFISTSFLFGLAHYNLNDFQHISTYNEFLNTFSFALIAVWITQNFGITKSILFHFCNNAIVVLLMLLSVQFPNTKKETFENNEIKVTWQKTPRFDSFSQNIIMNAELIKANNFSASEIYNSNSYFFIESKNNLEAYPTEPFVRYNFDVSIKKKTSDQTQINKLFNDFLIQKKLVSLLPKE